MTERNRSPLDQMTTMEPFINELHSSSIQLENCIIIAIKWTGFTKNNYLGSGIRCANALPSVIIFILVEALHYGVAAPFWSKPQFICIVVNATDIVDVIAALILTLSVNGTLMFITVQCEYSYYLFRYRFRSV